MDPRTSEYAQPERPLLGVTSWPPRKKGQTPVKKDSDIADKVGRLVDLIQRQRASLRSEGDREIGKQLSRRFDGDDLVQEAALVALRALPKLDVKDERRFGNYLRLAMRRVASRLGRDHAGATQK